jgi:hypothetical protein
MSEIAKQQKRINHMVMTIGKSPTVLDIEPASWDAIITELRADRRFRGCIKPPIPAWKPDCELSLVDEEQDVKVIELFGVRFCKGRV